MLITPSGALDLEDPVPGGFANYSTVVDEGLAVRPLPRPRRMIIVPSNKTKVVRRASRLPTERPADLLAPAAAWADGVTTLFFPYAEVIVHDLKTQQVAYIANNMSQREIGDDSALDRAEFGPDEQVIGPYEKRNWDGSKMRCVSIVIRSSAGTPIGLVCINFSIAVFEQAQSALQPLISGARLVSQPKSIFQDDWQERINTFVHAWLREHNAALNGLTRGQKRTLVEELYCQGGFQGRSAADYVARVLKMGRATVFKHIQEKKKAMGLPAKASQQAAGATRRRPSVAPSIQWRTDGTPKA